MGTVVHDVRLAARGLSRRPGFVITVVALVALGVGATTTIFSVVDAVLLTALPYPEPGDLVFFDHPSHSPPLFKDWRDRTHSFTTVAGARDAQFDMTSDGHPENVIGASITTEFFPLFGAGAHRGRLLAGDDFVGGPARVAVVSHGFWQRKWGGDLAAIGQTITLNGDPLEIVGVLSPQFTSPETMVGRQVDVWLPLDVDDADVDRRDRYILRVVARLRPGVDLEAARADVEALSRRLAVEFPERYTDRDGDPLIQELVTLHEATTGDIGSILWVLLGAVGLMLLIACANVANLFLARGTDRQREMALRAALGASRGRILSQLLTESVLLSVAGGALGVGLAVMGVRFFEALNPGGIPRADGIGVDLSVMAFALAVSVATGILFGMIPAIHTARADLHGGLKHTSHSLSAAKGTRRFRNALVVSEIAIALILLVGAGLLFNSFLRLRGVDPGINPANVTVVPLMLPPSYSSAERIPFVEQLLENAAAIPGVDEVAAGSTMPMAYPSGMCCYYTRIQPTTDRDDAPFSIVHPATPSYFSLLGATILKGRAFTTADREVGLAPAIVNETLARELFGEDDPLGKTVRFARIDWTVVGVAADIRHWGLGRSNENNLYVPHAIFGSVFRTLHLAVSSPLDAPALADALRQAVWSIDPNLPVPEVASLESYVSRSVAEPRFYSSLPTTFAVLAILLASGGIYGSMLYSVGQMHREIGIRIALGAGRSSVVAMIVRSGAALTLAGITLGLGGAYALSRTLESFVFGLTTTDAPTFAAVAVTLGAVAMASCYLPARRAAATDPIETLRSE